MKSILIISVWIASSSVFGQIPGKKIEGPIVIFDTLSIKKGDVIFLGRGSDSTSGNFIHITTPKKYMTDFSGNKSHAEFKNTPQGISNNYNGRSFTILNFSKISSKKNGDSYLGVFSIGPTFDGTLNMGMYKQAVDFEAAILAGEIIRINETNFSKPSNTLKKEIPHFVLTKEGVQPIRVIFPNIRRHELYTKTLNWYADHYQNKEENVLTTVEDEEVGIVGQKKGVLISRIMGTEVFGDLTYRLQIKFSENEIELNFSNVGEDHQNSESFSQEYYFDENGNVKKPYEELKTTLEQLMNELSSSLVDSIMD